MSSWYNDQKCNADLARVGDSCISCIICIVTSASKLSICMYKSYVVSCKCRDGLRKVCLVHVMTKLKLSPDQHDSIEMNGGNKVPGFISSCSIRLTLRYYLSIAFKSSSKNVV